MSFTVVTRSDTNVRVGDGEVKEQEEPEIKEDPEQSLRENADGKEMGDYVCLIAYTSNQGRRRVQYLSCQSWRMNYRPLKLEDLDGPNSHFIMKNM